MLVVHGYGKESIEDGWLDGWSVLRSRKYSYVYSLTFT